MKYTNQDTTPLLKSITYKADLNMIYTNSIVFPQKREGPSGTLDT